MNGGTHCSSDTHHLKTVVPMAGIGPATSPLPRECSTTEPHGQIHYLTQSDMERETGIEPVSLAWKAKVLPLNYSRIARALTARHRCPETLSERLSPNTLYLIACWWRRLDSNQRRRKPTDLQSAPFSHSGTPPQRTSNYATEKWQLPSRLPAFTIPLACGRGPPVAGWPR